MNTGAPFRRRLPQTNSPERKNISAMRNTSSYPTNGQALPSARIDDGIPLPEPPSAGGWGQRGRERAVRQDRVVRYHHRRNERTKVADGQVAVPRIPKPPRAGKRLPPG